jgi:prevent-host-death family protein
MSTMTIEEAQAKLSEVIDKLAPGEEVIITRNEQPVAKLVGQQRPIRKPRRPGSQRQAGDSRRRRYTPERLQGLHGVRLLLDTHTFYGSSWRNPN